MRHPDLDLLMVMERRRDELLAAEHSRLVKQARLAAVAATPEAAPKVPGISLRPFVVALSRSLAYLGERMLKWSERLQCRYHLLAATAENQPGPCS
jgi:hypothetical protein